ncbi:MAG: hypothetical protein UEI89_06330 [Lachnospira sp.]|nr:hypothetical protein [Lachnospira sp.]
MLKADKQTVLNSSIEMIRLYYEKEHKRNKDRIKYGIIAMLIIPIIFLILLFVVNSSKVIFLVMWIASLFIISGYLIAIEYKDYNMTENLKGIIDNSDNDALIDTTKVIKDIAMNYVSPVEYVKKNITEDTSDNFDSDINEKNTITDYADKNVYDNINKNIANNTQDNTTNNMPKNITNNISDNVSSDCQNIVIDNKPGNNKVTISVDNKTNAVCITINPDNSSKEAVR